MLSVEAARVLLSSFEVSRAFEVLEHEPGEDASVDLVRAIVAVYEESRAVRPSAREVGRVGDMAHATQSHMRIGLDSENDVYVAIWDDSRGLKQRASIEFCTRTAGGKSARTREALIAAMAAMEEDNAVAPHGQFPPAANCL